MGTFAVEGGHHLVGSIRPAGNKNAALPCLAATLLASEPVTLRNVPRIRDVLTFVEILTALGSEVSWKEELQKQEWVLCFIHHIQVKLWIVYLLGLEQ